MAPEFALLRDAAIRRRREFLLLLWCGGFMGYAEASDTVLIEYEAESDPATDMFDLS